MINKLIVLFVALLLSCKGETQNIFPSKIIWDKAPHNAFTSMIVFDNSLYLAFREGNKHVDRNGGDDGIIRVLKSEDGDNWISIDTISIKGRDLRDPQLSISPQGLLTVNFVAATYHNGHPTSYHTYMTEWDSNLFSKPEKLNTPLSNDWMWRLHWYKGRLYGFNYIESFDLLSSENGRKFELVKKFGLPGKLTETDFIQDGKRFLAIINRDNNSGLIGRGLIDKGIFKWFDTKIQFVGPMLFEIDPHTILFLATVYVAPRKLEQRIYKIKGTSLKHLVTLPSSADCGYMGAAIFKNSLYVSYYSTVSSGKVAVYLSSIPLSFFVN